MCAGWSGVAVIKVQTVFKLLSAALVLLIVVSIIFNGFFYYKLNTLEKQNNLLKNVLSLKYGYSEDKTTAGRYYEQASLSYERDDFLAAESNCKLSREHYSKHIQIVKREIVEIQSRTEGQKQKIFEIYISLLMEEVNIGENMFEACEWFESASRHYNNRDFDKGNSAITEMNIKIQNHDTAVRKYNYLLEEFNLEKQNLI